MDPKQIVAQGYDAIAGRHAEWASHTRTDERERYTAILLNALPPGARVLELGCGVGVPTTRQLTHRFAVTGVDISAQHIALARRNVPAATFVQADMAALDFPPASFDAVAAVERVPHVQGLRGLGVSWSPYLYLSPFRPDDPDKACPCCKVPLSLRRHPRLVLGWRGHFDGQIRCEGDGFILVAGDVGRCLS